MTLIVKNLSFEREHVVLFEKLNFHLAPGKLLQVIGANGSGKTTLLRIIAGFIEATGGTISWHGDSSGLLRSSFQQNLSYLGHQNGLKLLLTLSENIKLMCSLQGIKISDASIRDALQRVGLLPFETSQVRCLSAGQQRRLSYSRLFLVEKLLWILDEPATAVDEEGQRIFTQLIQRHLSHGGMAIIATHQLLSLDHPLQTLNLSAKEQCELTLC